MNLIPRISPARSVEAASGTLRRRMIAVGCALALVLAGCASDEPAAAPPATPPPPAETTSPPPAETTSPPATEAPASEATGDSDQPPAQLIATTSIWADITRNVACGGLAEVESLLPPLADPHDFEPSMADRARLDAADLIVANGLGLEEGLVDTLASAEADGTPIFSAAEHVTTLEFDAEMFSGHAHGEDEHEDHDDDHEDHDDDHDEDDHDEDHEDHEDHDDDDHADDHDDDDHAEGHEDDDHADDDHAEDHEDDDHADDDHAEGHEDDDHAEGHEDDDHAEDHEDDDHDEHEDEHDHGSEDPHVWLDPVRVAQAAEILADTLVDQLGLDADRVAACSDAYLAELAQLHEDIAETLEAVPPTRRKLVTNHDALGYFADRYNFEVIGTVIPSVSTLAEPSPAGLETLAELIEETGVSAIFGEFLDHHRDVAIALADRLEGVSVANLYTGALGPEGSGAENYLAMMRLNAQTIAEALSG